MLRALKEERQCASGFVTRTQNKVNLEAQNCWRAGASLSIESSKRPWNKNTKSCNKGDKTWICLREAVAQISDGIGEDEAGGIQETFANAIPTLPGIDPAVCWTDTHERGGTIDEVDPDFTASRINFQPTKYTAIAFLEFKSANLRSLGQAADLIARTLDVQGARAKAVVLLFNGWEAVEVRGERTTVGDLLFHESSVVTGDSAWDALRGFLCASPESLGAVKPVRVGNTDYFLTSIIGRGTTCRVFAAVSADGKDEAVVKFCEQIEQAKAEAKNIATISKFCWSKQRSCDCVPRVLQVDDRTLTTVLQPKGRHFRIDSTGQRRFLFKHACALLNLLKKVHQEFGLVHRDVKPDNFFLLPDNTVLLSDWADALPFGTDCDANTQPLTIFYPPCTANPHRAQYYLDRYSFVVSCYACTWPEPHNFLPTSIIVPEAWQKIADSCLLAPNQTDSSSDAVYDKLLLALKPLLHQ